MKRHIGTILFCTIGCLLFCVFSFYVCKIVGESLFQINNIIITTIGSFVFCCITIGIHYALYHNEIIQEEKVEIDTERMQLLTLFLKNYYSSDGIPKEDAQKLIDASLLTSIGYVSENTISWSSNAYAIIKEFENGNSMVECFKKVKQ